VRASHIDHRVKQNVRHLYQAGYPSADTEGVLLEMGCRGGNYSTARHSIRSMVAEHAFGHLDKAKVPGSSSLNSRTNHLARNRPATPFKQTFHLCHQRGRWTRPERALEWRVPMAYPRRAMRAVPGIAGLAYQA